MIFKRYKWKKIYLGLGAFCCLINLAFSAKEAPNNSEDIEKSALAVHYSKIKNDLKQQLLKIIPNQQSSQADLESFVSQSDSDEKLVKYIVLKEATTEALSNFAGKDKSSEGLVNELLENTALMKQMLVADGAARSRVGRGQGPAEYGIAMQIYKNIQNKSKNASEGVLQKLALAISLEHAVPRVQRNAKDLLEAPKYVDPVLRYLSYEKAYLEGELDPAFASFDTWELRFVIDGEEPDDVATWGRKMLRNYRPDHVLNGNYGWKYVGIVPSDIRYGSGDVKYDRGELQFFQNILMNGGICGRRAFFGRFVLRSFGIPTTARPSRGHAALAHWTPNGWVVNLGPRWGGGWTKTVYKKDKDFLASTQARLNKTAYLKVKRALWIGDVVGEKRVYGESAGKAEFWNALSLNIQREIIKESKAKTLEALGTHLGESNNTLAQKIKSAVINDEDKKITADENGNIKIPAAGYSKPTGKSKDVVAMKSFEGGMQVFLPRFSRKGITILRGGAWRGGSDGCRSAARVQSSGYGRYNNWGFRAAMTPKDGQTDPELIVDLGDGVKIEMIYIKPGTFIMGGKRKTDSKWSGIESPKHEVMITKGYYLGKYEVTQAQFKKIMNSNPSKASKDPKCPADNISEGDAREFCSKASYSTGHEFRLPTEAEWEYACRAGSTTAYFFGDDSAKLGDYAWYKDNDGGKSHPVGQKKANPWGLYDIVGNVCERVSDTYAKNYYAKSPKKDPIGPLQADKSRFEFEVDVPTAGMYLLTARVVTANYDQKLMVTVNEKEVEMTLPFTLGEFKNSKPITLILQKGKNTIKFLRRKPPQFGIAIKSFELIPAES
jgi:formylglycine-generating enzyme required for sulfatase activity